jgi:peptidoglycan/LPS O-acetylase OafA/YrhL
VLSGFLITYLLLKEKDLGGIGIRNFYLRRILRIWPLYYLIVALCFCLVPYVEILHVEGCAEHAHNDLAAKLFLFVAMMANVAFVLLPTVPFANVLWSVAVEEQFYLFWPHLMKRTGGVLRAMLIVLGAYMLVKLVLVLLLGRLDGRWVETLLHLMDRTRFSSMVIGAVGAYSAHARWERGLSLLFLPLVQVVAWSAMLVVTIVPWHRAFFGLFGNELTSLVVLCIRAFVPLYAAHPDRAGWLGVLLLLATTALSIGIAHISYYHFELRFLRKKKASSAIVSGDLVKRE